MGPTDEPGSNINTRHLSKARRHLLHKMQELGFGRIRQLAVMDGEPIVNPAPKYEKVHLFGRGKRPSPGESPTDFILKKKLVELFEIFDRDRTFAIKELVIEDGLPVRMTVAESAQV